MYLGCIFAYFQNSESKPNIHSTYKKHTLDLQSETIQHVIAIDSKYMLHSEYIQNTFKMRWQHARHTFEIHSQHIQNAFEMQSTHIHNIQSTYNPDYTNTSPPTHIQNTIDAHSKCIQLHSNDTSKVHWIYDKTAFETHSKRNHYSSNIH